MSATLPTLPANRARATLYPLIESVAVDGPIQVTGKRSSAVLVSLDEWNALQESLFIASQPKLMAKIKASARVPRSKMKTLDQIA